MSMNREIVVLSAVRTAVGSFGGSLKKVPAVELAQSCVSKAVASSGVSPDQIGHCVFGNVIHGDRRDMYMARVAGIYGGLSVETPAYTVNRLCGSGLQAIVSASQQIETNQCDFAVAGGAENMSRSVYWAPDLRWGARMTDSPMIDAMLGALTDPFDGDHMGMTAEHIVEKWGITREEQDLYSAESHRRASNAWDNGFYDSQIVPICTNPAKDDAPEFSRDEHIRPGVTVSDLASLRPVFKKDGSVTAGNASGCNDGASALILAAADSAEEQGLTPMARLIGYSFSGVEPKYMGIGPVPAVKKLLDRTGLSVNDFDVIELNEAFAAQVIAVCRDLNLPMDKVNPNGSGISLGHPVGATGAVLTTKAIHELHRTGGRYALVTMCIGGGQGIAAAFERL